MRRTNRNGLKRIGALALALVIALGSLGVAYAAWTDSVYIEGTVYTGTLDIDIAGVSSTYVYKVPGAPDDGFGPETVVNYTFGTANDPDAPTETGTELIAWAITEDTSAVSGDVDSATMIFSGLFPGIDFIADLELQYLGSIPAKVSIAEISPDNDDADASVRDAKDAILLALWQLGETTRYETTRYGAWIDGDIKPYGTSVWVDIDDPLGLQLHQFDLVHIALHVRLPQITGQPTNPLDQSNLKGLTDLDFTGLITVIQWNEYPEP